MLCPARRRVCSLRLCSRPAAVQPRVGGREGAGGGLEDLRPDTRAGIVPRICSLGRYAAADTHCTARTARHRNAREVVRWPSSTCVLDATCNAWQQFETPSAWLSARYVLQLLRLQDSDTVSSARYFTISPRGEIPGGAAVSSSDEYVARGPLSERLATRTVPRLAVQLAGTSRGLPAWDVHYVDLTDPRLSAKTQLQAGVLGATGRRSWLLIELCGQLSAISEGGSRVAAPWQSSNTASPHNTSRSRPGVPPSRQVRSSILHLRTTCD